MRSCSRTSLSTLVVTAALYCLLLSTQFSAIQAQNTSPSNTIVENAIALRDVIGSKLQPLMTAPEFSDIMARMLDPASRLTVFIPVEEATKDMNIGLDQVQDALKMLRYHVVEGVFRSSSIPMSPDEISLNTLFFNSPPMRLSRTSENDIQINSPTGVVTKVVMPDIICANGVIHLIDAPIDVPGINMAQFYSDNPGALPTPRGRY